MRTLEKILTGEFTNNSSTKDKINLKYTDGKLTGQIRKADGDFELLSGELVTEDLIILRSVHLDGSVSFYIFEAFSLLELRGIYMKKSDAENSTEMCAKHIFRRKDIVC